ncbi:anthrone oxygenase family protein [Streptomyces sp. NPDC005474]|uniref:anthrone oxygenase family protein n=1 Tax=Streptomyces sp. NPDC005474 TaxID=3154878 RepID=UPI00345618E0
MTDSVIVTIVRFVNLLFAGLFAGFLVTVLVIESTLRSFDAAVYTQVRLVELVHLDDLATASLVPTLTTTVVLVFFGAKVRGRTFWLTLTALLLLVVVFATSLLVNVPINTDQLAWSVHAPPAGWASVRDRWQIAHAVRTVAALLAFAGLSAAATHKSSVIRLTAHGSPAGGTGRSPDHPVRSSV